MKLGPSRATQLPRKSWSLLGWSGRLTGKMCGHIISDQVFTSHFQSSAH